MVLEKFSLLGKCNKDIAYPNGEMIFLISYLSTRNLLLLTDITNVISHKHIYYTYDRIWFVGFYGIFRTINVNWIPIILHYIIRDVQYMSLQWQYLGFMVSQITCDSTLFNSVEQHVQAKNTNSSSLLGVCEGNSPVTYRKILTVTRQFPSWRSS